MHKIYSTHQRLVMLRAMVLVLLDAGFLDVGFLDVGFLDVGFLEVGFLGVGFLDFGFLGVGFQDVGLIVVVSRVRVEVLKRKRKVIEAMVLNCLILNPGNPPEAPDPLSASVSPLATVSFKTDNFPLLVIMGKQVWMGCECEPLNGLIVNKL